MSSPPPSSSLSISPRSYVPALDGFRAIAALAVLGFHAQLPGFGHGNVGVYMFFTLSGFLITRILIGSLERGPLDYWEFYRRRALRLLPPYLAVLVLCVMAEPFSDVGGTLKGALFSLAYMANVPTALGVGLGALVHTWTLSIEEQFYLIWPVLLVYLAKGTQPPTLTITGMALAAWGAASTLAAVGVDPAIVANTTPIVAVHMLAGCALATWEGRGVLGKCGPFALVGLLALASVEPPGGVAVLWPLLACASAIVIAAAEGDGPLAKVLGWKPLASIGKVSYGLYLWHFPILVHIDYHFGLDTWAPRVLGIALTAFVVPLSYRYIEQPFLRMKDQPIFSREWFRMKALTRVQG